MQLGIVIAQLLLQYGPDLAAKFVDIIHSDKEPTIDDWRQLLAKASAKSYDDYLTAAQTKTP